MSADTITGISVKAESGRAEWTAQIVRNTTWGRGHLVKWIIRISNSGLFKIRTAPLELGLYELGLHGLGLRGLGLLRLGLLRLGPFELGPFGPGQLGLLGHTICISGLFGPGTGPHPHWTR